MTTSIHTQEMKALAAWFRSAREAQGWSMRELATRIGKPHNFVQRVEECERRLDVVEFVWYCEALSLKPEVGLAIVMNKNTSS